MTIEQTFLLYILIIASAFGLVCIAGVQRKVIIYRTLQFGENSDLLGLLMLLCAFLVLLVPLVSRTCGVDTPQYYRTYVSDDTSGLDFVFYALCKVLHSFVRDPQTGLGIISAITLLLTFYSIYRVQANIELHYAVFAYLTSIYFYLYNYMRIMLATSFVFLGYSCIMKNQKKRAVLFFCIACLFHRSAVVVLIIYIIALIFKKHKKLVIAIALIMMAAVLLRPAFFLSLVSIERYSSMIDISAIGSSSIGLGTTVRILPFFLLLFIYREYRYEIEYIMALYFMLANLGFSFLGYYVDSASRLSNMYFVFHLIFFTPWLVRQEVMRNRSTTCLKLFFVAYCIIVFYQMTSNFEIMGIVPYA